MQSIFSPPRGTTWFLFLWIGLTCAEKWAVALSPRPKGRGYRYVAPLGQGQDFTFCLPPNQPISSPSLDVSKSAKVKADVGKSFLACSTGSFRRGSLLSALRFSLFAIYTSVFGLLSSILRFTRQASPNCAYVV